MSRNSFENFFYPWLLSQEYYMNQLRFLSSQNHPGKELEDLVKEVLLHYQLYYRAKARVANEDVFILFTPPWFSTLERSLLWITGLKPSLTFRVMEKSVGSELTFQQGKEVANLTAKITMNEKMLGKEMANIQESIAGQPWVEAAIRRWEQKNQGEEAADELIESVGKRLKELVVKADLLRMTTTTELVNILSSSQAARFLAAAAQHHLRVRAWGLESNADRENMFG